MEHISNFKIKDKNPQFSFLIPVYNSEKTLKRCLDSVLNQSLKNIEVIAVDDGSKDNSYRILNEYSLMDNRLRVIRKEKNCSLLSARITAMNESKGEYVLFLDSDDFYETDSCQILSDKLSKVDVDIIEFAFVREPKNKIVRNKLRYDKENIVRNVLCQEWPHTVWNKCYSRRLIDDFLNNAEEFYCNMTEDVYFTVLFFSLSKSYLKIKNVLYHYNEEDGMSNAKRLSELSIQNIYKSIKNKDDKLRLFLSSKNPQMVELVDLKEKMDIDEMARLCCKQKIPIEERIIAIKYFDSMFETNFASKFEKDLSEAYVYLDTIEHTRKKDRIWHIIKNAKKDLLR